MDNIRIYGDITDIVKNSIKKVYYITPKNIWNNINNIFVSNIYDEEEPNRLGAYISGYIYKGGRVIIQCTKKKYIINENSKMPIIYLNTRVCNDEFHIAFNLLHELGHHNKGECELDANEFALKYIRDFIFTKKLKINYTDLGWL